MKNVSQRLFLAAAVAALLFARPAAAQQQIQPVGYKDPGTATIMSVIIPGGGHLYSGETKKGAMILGVGLGGLVLGSALTAGSAGIDCDYDDFECEDNTSYLPAAAGYLLYLGSWVYGIMDGSDSAARMNAKNGLAVGGVRVQPAVGVQPQGGAQVGLELRF
jgi:opacity protein-like surface antigen